MTGAVLGMKSKRKIGLVHGAAVGAFTGAFFSLHAVSAAFSLWISFHDNEPPSFPLLDANADDDDQVATVETNNQVPRFIDRKGGNGLHTGSILDKLPKTRITYKNIYDSSGNRISCSVCLEVCFRLVGFRNQELLSSCAFLARASFSSLERVSSSFARAIVPSLERVSGFRPEGLSSSLDRAFFRSSEHLSCWLEQGFLGSSVVSLCLVARATKSSLERACPVYIHSSGI
ncbi:hypothetical protein HYC85_020756 [Camellia sinensis]|uniref:Uncharacterized protein n=1 Tax=Camellia sinensis TaxID=4442 RepID=A0A7J7GUJ2_CAMSI|nr:hypothetical protein HYC85_020756 [Camellia sinensis]